APRICGPVMAGRIVGADPVPTSPATSPAPAADSARAQRDSTRRAVSDSAAARPSPGSALFRPVLPSSNSSSNAVAKIPDTTTRAAPPRAPAAAAVEPPKTKPKPPPSDFSSVWHRTTKAERDSIRHARAEEDSVRRAEKAAAKEAAKARKHAKAAPDTTRQGQR